MIEIIPWLVFGFVMLRLGVVWINLLSRPILKNASPGSLPLVSILVPARNEADNLPQLFKQLGHINYPELEFIFLDDHSEDTTQKILNDYCQEEKRARYISGKDLPSGWLGKNWACHQLGQEAKGEYLLFLDADIAEIHEDLLNNALAFSEKYELKLLSLFPDQIMRSQGEKVIVPIMHYLLLSLLPLWAIYKLPFPSMAAANGQFMLFEGNAYRKYLFHQRARKQIVEDIYIMQDIKRLGLKGMTLVANGFIRCRMYHSYAEGLHGFSKNLLAGFGNSIAGMWIYLILIVAAWTFFIALHQPYIWLLSAIGIVLIRVGISILARQSVWQNIIYHPLQIGNLLIIAILSTTKKWRKQNFWKGRNVELD